MKITRKILFSALIILLTLSFTRIEKNTEALNIGNVDVISILSKEDAGNRPSSKFTFYVDTEIVKKARGYSLIKASIYIYERATGKFNLLAAEKIISPIHKDTFLDYEISKYNSNTKLLENGDKILNNELKSQYSFNELIDYKTIYESYMNSKNKLLKK